MDVGGHGYAPTALLVVEVSKYLLRRTLVDSKVISMNYQPSAV
jgi:hypothetical protein